jgi:hypothetical protein
MIAETPGHFHLKKDPKKFVRTTYFNLCGISFYLPSYEDVVYR